ncbi:MAG: calcium-binding protein, partial [Ilumatobacteraceae bacterium]
FVVFTSGASNLITGDTNSRIDVFVRDLQTNTTERVNLTSTGGEPTGALPQFTTASPTISADGRFVSFDSSATNLVPGATTAQRRVYVRDRMLGTTILVGRGSAGEISDNGKVVVFSSFDALTGDDTNGVSDLFTMVLSTGAITRASVATGNIQAAQGGSGPSVSADGRFVSFESASVDLVAGDTNGTGDVFLHDRQTGITTRVSVGATGAEVNGQSFSAAVSTDGRFVTFTSFADNLAPGDVNGSADVFVYDTGVIAP